MNKLHKRMTREKQILTRSDPISRNNYQYTNHTCISILLDEQIEQKNDERQSDTHNEIEANDLISRNEYQDSDYLGQRYFAK